MSLVYYFFETRCMYYVQYQTPIRTWLTLSSVRAVRRRALSVTVCWSSRINLA